MYLKTICLRNTGPVKELELNLPFDGERPKPLILVGRNGSGKSTLISFIVNALVGLKQKAFENIEVEQGKVYRLRSPLGINGTANHYFAKLVFDKGVSLIEWQLDRQKQQFGADVDMMSVDKSWRQIPPNETSYYLLNLGDLAQPHLLEEMLNSTSLLFFPADRFEPPDWLNLENLSTDLQLPESERIKGRTQRRIFARNRLKPTLEWLNAVIFDMFVTEHHTVNIPWPGPPGQDPKLFQGLIAIPGPTHSVFASIRTILKQVLSGEMVDDIQLAIGHRKARIISATVMRQNTVIRYIKDLMSLSAGESALFCLFASIVRDADMSSMPFMSPADIRGIVIIDEADLHLHVNFQYDTLPRLIALFPKVQFIISVHAPMVAVGLEKVLGSDGFEIREMPTGERIDPEGYAEFLSAFDVFSATHKFQSVLITKINETVLPVLLVEGKSDVIVLMVAWKKLYPEIPIPFEVVPCGVDADPDRRNGGAEMLRRCVEFLTIVKATLI